MIKVIKWALVLICMIQIFLFSADPAYQSDQKSNGVIIWIAEKIVGHTLNETERENKINQFALVVRKSAHISIYWLLGLLVLSLLKEYKPIDWKIMLKAFALSFLYACSDEIHQLYVPGRSGSIIDIGIDSIGIYLGVLSYYYFYKLRRKHEQEKTIC